MKGKRLAFLTLIFCLFAAPALQARPRLPLSLPQPHPASVLMMSDLHFDPFRDPAKVPALRAAAVEQWTRILNDPDSQTQAAAFGALQTACKARGVDSSWAVVKSSLQAAKSQQARPLFVTVDGDLLAHNFDCRLRTLDPSVTADGISEFAEKTIDFLTLQYRQSFPKSPVYMALGNNDSGCSNYHQDADSAFLRNVDRSLARDFSRARDAMQVLPAFSDRGDYSVLLPGAMHNTRLIVLQNVFSTPTYAGCGGAADQKIVAQQLDWLKRQLEAARGLHQKVWVMAHIPPGVDTFATYHRFFGKPEGMCSVAEPVMLQTSDEMVQLLLQYATNVRLAVFAHTHMDEMKLLHGANGAAIPAKFIPAVSPVNGNTPSFLLASVQPNTATLLDYRVLAATDVKATEWHEEYRYSTAYRLPDYSAASVEKLTSQMMADKAGDTDISQAYQRWFLPGDDGKYARNVHSVWPSYACSLGEDGGEAYHRCVCPAGTAAPRSQAAQQ